MSKSSVIFRFIILSFIHLSIQPGLSDSHKAFKHLCHIQGIPLLFIFLIRLFAFRCTRESKAKITFHMFGKILYVHFRCSGLRSCFLYPHFRIFFSFFIICFSFFPVSQNPISFHNVLKSGFCLSITRV